MRRNRRRAGGALLLLAFCFSAFGQKPRAKADTFIDPKSGPFTLEKVVECLAVIPKARLITAIQNRGVAFNAAPINVAAIREAARGDSDLIGVIQGKMLPYIPPPPPAPVVGSLVVTCEPLECNVALPGGAPTTTRAGQALFGDINPGEVTVELSKPNYLPQRKTVKIEAEARAEVLAKLELSPDGKRALLQAAMDPVWKALNAGDKGIADRDVISSGSANMYDAGGKETNWAIMARFSAASSTIELKNQAGKLVLEVECNGDDCKPSGKKLNAGSKKAEIDPEFAAFALKRFHQVHLGSMLARLSTPEIRVLSAKIDDTGIKLLHLENNEENFDVQLAANMLVAQVTVTSKLGLGDGYQVVYSDYRAMEKTNAQYPKRTSFKALGDKRGMKVDLDFGR